MKTFDNDIQKILASLEPTQRYRDLLESSSDLNQLQKALGFSNIGDSQNSSTVLAEQVINQLADNSLSEEMNRLMNAEKSVSVFDNSYAKILRALTPSEYAIGSHFEELRKSGILEFNNLFTDLIPGKLDITGLIRQSDTFAEIEISGSQFIDLLAPFNLNIDFDVDDEEPHEVDEERRILLPEDFQRSFIDVRGIPLRLLELLKHSPQITLQSLSWQQLEDLIAEICKEKLGGKDVYITRGSTKGDHGLDVVSTFEVDGVKTVFGMQCKKYSPDNKIEGYQVRELKGALSLGPHKATSGILCTTSGFRPQASNYFIQNVELNGWDPEDIAAIVRGEKTQINK